MIILSIWFWFSPLVWLIQTLRFVFIVIALRIFALAVWKYNCFFSQLWLHGNHSTFPWWEGILYTSILYSILIFFFWGNWILKLEESKKERGERVEDGTFQRDRALYEVFSLASFFSRFFFSYFDQIAAEWLLLLQRHWKD